MSQWCFAISSKNYLQSILQETGQLCMSSKICPYDNPKIWNLEQSNPTCEKYSCFETGFM